ncbi:MAG: hypothetical protein KC656_26125 [Myxococcales bacterium]|nr:hypothetical protein [Myxococcales bacterium]
MRWAWMVVLAACGGRTDPLGAGKDDTDTLTGDTDTDTPPQTTCDLQEAAYTEGSDLAWDDTLRALDATIADARVAPAFHGDEAAWSEATVTVTRATAGLRTVEPTIEDPNCPRQIRVPVDVSLSVSDDPDTEEAEAFSLDWREEIALSPAAASARPPLSFGTTVVANDVASQLGAPAFLALVDPGEGSTLTQVVVSAQFGVGTQLKGTVRVAYDADGVPSVVTGVEFDPRFTPDTE